MSSLIGEKLSRYSVIEELGAGGMGIVYRARDDRLQRDVALKVLPANVVADETVRRRFQREALFLAQLSHPNVAAVYDFDSDRGIDFLVMEYVSGIPLNASQTRHSESEVGDLGRQLADGLAAAHDRAVIHRDIKPGNLIVTSAGQLKILDFGLAKLLPSSEMASEALTVTASHNIAGTLPYMSPEQLRGEQVDARTDIWAAGAVLYELATGWRPFRAQTAASLTDAILHHNPQPPREQNLEISVGLDRIILKCLQKNPEARYKSAHELGTDLSRLSSSAPTEILPQPGYTSIAVLPLTNYSSAQEEEYFADGMTEALITELAQIRSLRVISRTSSMRYKTSDKPLPEIARELGVDNVMEGSIQRSGTRVRITAQLIHAPTDRHLWARTYDRDVRDILIMQAEIAGEVAREISGHFGSALASRTSVNPEAYDAYLRGNFDFYGWQLGKSLEAYQRAIDGEPNFAPSYARMAGCYYLQAFLGVMAPHDAFSKVRSLAAEALAKDSGLAEGLGQRALVNLHYDWDWFAAERDFRLALEIDPSNADNHHYYAHFLLAMNRPEQNVAEMRKAVSLDPQNPILRVCYGWHKLFSGDVENSLADADRASEMAPNLFWSPMVRGWAFEQQGKFVEAVAEFEVALEQSGAMTIAAAARAHALALAGEKKQAEEVALRLIESLQTSYVSAFDIASIFMGLGDLNKTFEWLQNAVRERSTWLVHVGWEPRFKTIRRDPRFADIIRAIGLPVHSVR
jgi:serine/threonine protein kinase/tetratricopeptide (TPR) repeat protein